MICCTDELGTEKNTAAAITRTVFTESLRLAGAKMFSSEMLKAQCVGFGDI